MSDFRWQAHVETRMAELMARRHVRLYLWRNTPDGWVEVRMEGGEIRRIEEGISFPEGAGLLLHAEEWAAIEAEVEPQAHNAEIRRLEETLSLERERVDRLLAAVTIGDAGARDVTQDPAGQVTNGSAQ